MLVCTGLCEYYETYERFVKGKSYQTHKQCTRCYHIVNKEEFPDVHCYCCNSFYRNRYPISIETRREARKRKRIRRALLKCEHF